MVQVSTDRVGDRWVEDYDRGVIETMGATIIDSDYFLQVANVTYGYFSHNFRRPELRDEPMPGIHVIFASPDDRITDFSLPCVVVRRESVEPAAERWPSVHLEYRTAAPGATEIVINYAGVNYTGYTSYEEKLGGWPFDITYMISVLSGGEDATRAAQRMLRHIMRIYPPKAGFGVTAKDSLGQEATFETFSEGPLSLKEALDVVDRQAGFSINIKVQALIDLTDPYFTEPVRSTDFNYAQDP